MISQQDSLRSFDTATGHLLYECTVTEPDTLQALILKGKKASIEWANFGLEKRIDYLQVFAKLLKEKQDQFAHWISQENGKLLSDARGEVTAMVAKVEISIEAYRDRCKILSYPLGHIQSVTRFKPQGLLAVFGPFNFPGHLPNGHIVPALLAGNAVIFKPSELTPFTGAKLVELYHAAGFPESVIQVVQGGAAVGQALAASDDIDGVLFTGSASAGFSLQEALLKKPGKILALEMGGNNALVISETANIDATVRHTLQSAYLSSGQRCTCARRLIVIKNNCSQQFLKTLQKRINEITVGLYTDTPEPFMGPVINQKAVERLLSAQSQLEKEGAEVLVRMKQPNEKHPIVSPAFLDVTECRNRADEEIFGPFLQLIRVENFEEAIHEANQTRFGLIAGLMSDHIEEYQLFWKRIKAGLINWNTPLTGASSKAPFGGVKSSGNYRPSAYFAADYCSYPVASMEAPALPPKKEDNHT
ncbi:N-succinylglutamate 5-semialdehyde dehydrogenase [Chlamydiales bacterium STE3]|nr:N-succinylglutamate 5-semialdehyde dehydrogenase [Chlamydiales bacterium STE3]